MNKERIRDSPLQASRHQGRVMNGAIETQYRGYLFRSRLEARWAVFFDALQMEWQYETQGYELGDCRYLPDFWLPQIDAFVEVKGDPDGLRKDFARMSAILGPKSPLPGFAAGKTSLIVLGQVPEPHIAHTILHATYSRRSGILARSYGFFAPTVGGPGTYLSDTQQSVLHMLFGRYSFTDPSDSADSKAWDFSEWLLETPGSFAPINEAYRKARQARFEHGANG
jgi:hypothetical protein